MLKTVILVTIAGLIGGTGHVMLSAGMRTVGDLTESAAGGRASMVWAAASHPWVLVGVFLQATFFFLYLALLSREDLTVVLPMTAISYVAIALGAQVFLAEALTPIRWAGIGFILIGVALISQS
jgi:drug/metabolite transporter (DMT)-like permease